MSTVQGIMESLTEVVFGVAPQKPKKSTKANLYCRVCKKNYIELRNEFTVSGKSYGEAEILFSARAEKKDVIVCSRCVCSHSLIKNNGGDAIVMFDNDRNKFKADTKKSNSLTEDLRLEDVKNMKEILGG